MPGFLQKKIFSLPPILCAERSTKPNKPRLLPFLRRLAFIVHHSSFIILYSALLIPHSALFAQHPFWRHYSIYHGLPSNVVNYMVQDRQGLLWVMTSQGICRFNGYEFRCPVDTSVLAASPSFNPFEDAKGCTVSFLIKYREAGT